MIGGLGNTRPVRYVQRDIWRVRQKDLPRRRSIVVKALRVIILSLRGVGKDRCALQASALTFYSLLSLVPVIAMLFAIAKGFGFQKALEKTLLEQLEGQEEVVTKILEFSQAFLDSVTSGVVAGVGLVLLLYTIIKILSQTERALNDIWGVHKGRSLGRKISDYLSLMLVCPVIFLLSSSMTVFLTSGVKMILTKISLLGPLGPVLFFLLKLIPYCAVWLLFSLLYIVLPNTKVRILSGVLGGIIAGTMYQVFQWGYIQFQIGASKYNAIYGSFAALPLFFVWLQVSWLIVLFGAEICLAHQNLESFEYGEDCENASLAFKKLISLRVMQLMVLHFLRGEAPPLDAREISLRIEAPSCLVHDILYDLEAAGLISEVMDPGGRPAGYQPAKDPNILTVKYVIDALEQRGTDSIPVDPSEELQRLAETMNSLDSLIQNSPANKPLKEV